MLYLRSSQQCCWKFRSTTILHRVYW